MGQYLGIMLPRYIFIRFFNSLECSFMRVPSEFICHYKKGNDQKMQKITICGAKYGTYGMSGEIIQTQRRAIRTLVVDNSKD